MFLSLLSLCALFGLCFTMNAEKPNFLSQPVVKNIFVYRNGDPYYEARRLVINEKRVSNFETFLREVTGGVKPPFGAVRNIYTPKEGHRVASMEHLQTGEQYVAAGREKFKKLDYLQIGERRRRMQQTNGLIKPVPQNRIVVSARFLKPIKEPCAIFVMANGDLLSPAVRLLIPHRIVGQYDRILEMITEKMGLKILGGVHSLYMLNGTQITDGKELESGQLYIAVGRDKFKKLPYNDMFFGKPAGIKRVFGSKALSLPPISRTRKQNGSMSIPPRLACSEPSEGEPSIASQRTREHLSSIVKQVSQSRLITLRNKKSGLSMSLSVNNNGDGAPGTEEAGGENSEEKPPEQEDPKAEQTQAEEQAEQKTGSDDPDATTTQPADKDQPDSSSASATEAQGTDESKAAEESTDTSKETGEEQIKEREEDTGSEEKEKKEKKKEEVGEEGDGKEEKVGAEAEEKGGGGEEARESDGGEGKEDGKKDGGEEVKEEGAMSPESEVSIKTNGDVEKDRETDEKTEEK